MPREGHPARAIHHRKHGETSFAAHGQIRGATIATLTVVCIVHFKLSEFDRSLQAVPLRILDKIKKECSKVVVIFSVTRNI
ncbi:hypothetical protein QE152_g9848 [Popillia japonica]|uniref:Uncharacterized protein n=1 Tax=Popillia japonica TaxID=7064 RepID=A0AAW1LTK0_POPJA